MYNLTNAGCTKANDKAWAAICEVFNSMPLAAVLEGKVFCVHGCISPSLIDYKQIQKLDKKDIDRQAGGMARDLVWSEPDSMISGFEENVKGIGYSVGSDSVERFLLCNNLDLIVRSQQILEDGFELAFDRRIVNLFSAVNFQGKYGNCAAVMLFREDLTCEFQLLRPK